MNAILFGFGPFSKYRENPSRIIVEMLDGGDIDGINVRGVILPVTYSKVRDIVRREILKEKPDVSLGIGLAAGRIKITLEKIAVNYEYSTIPDEYGRKGRGKKIDPKGPDGIFTNLKIEKLVKILNSEKIPSEISLSAGGYICNLTMYTIMQNSLKIGKKGGFIHIPCHRELVASSNDLSCPFMELDTMLKAVKIVLKNSLNFSIHRMK